MKQIRDISKIFFCSAEMEMVNLHRQKRHTSTIGPESEDTCQREESSIKIWVEKNSQGPGTSDGPARPGQREEAAKDLRKAVPLIEIQQLRERS